jgi:hypothetical protein
MLAPAIVAVKWARNQRGNNLSILQIALLTEICVVKRIPNYYKAYSGGAASMLTWPNCVRNEAHLKVL